MRNFLLICALSGTFFTLSGCGKKGALYLPDTATPKPSLAQPSQPAQPTQPAQK
jgi:predicted small lipoprotein YifL